MTSACLAFSLLEARLITPGHCASPAVFTSPRHLAQSAQRTASAMQVTELGCQTRQCGNMFARSVQLVPITPVLALGIGTLQVSRGTGVVGSAAFLAHRSVGPVMLRTRTVASRQSMWAPPPSRSASAHQVMEVLGATSA